VLWGAISDEAIALLKAMLNKSPKMRFDIE
jgi:hypothetical protein